MECRSSASTLCGDQGPGAGSAFGSSATARAAPKSRSSLLLESLLALRLETDKLHFASCVPAELGAFTVHYRYRETVYHIVLTRAGDGNAASVTGDGIEQADRAVPLVDDHLEHSVGVRLAAAEGNQSTVANTMVTRPSPGSP